MFVGTSSFGFPTPLGSRCSQHHLRFLVAGKVAVLRDCDLDERAGGLAARVLVKGGRRDEFRAVIVEPSTGDEGVLDLLPIPPTDARGVPEPLPLAQHAHDMHADWEEEGRAGQPELSQVGLKLLSEGCRFEESVSPPVVAVGQLERQAECFVVVTHSCLLPLGIS